MVIDAVNANYSQIRSAYAVLSDVTQDSTVEKQEEITRRLPGGEAIIWKLPRMELKGTWWLRGDDLRYDQEPLGSTPASLARIIVRKEGVWTQYSPNSSHAWIRRTESLPGFFLADLREIGSESVKRGMVDVLREDWIVSAQLVQNDSPQGFVRIITERPSGDRTTYEFAVEENLLPTRFYTKRGDGSLVQFAEIEYQDVLEGRAKFLRRMTRRYFDKGVTDIPSEEGWRQWISLEVVELELNREVPDELFALEFPPGTRVDDTLRHDIYKTRPPPEPRRLAWRWLLFLGLPAVVLLLLAVRAIKGQKRTANIPDSID
jgi:hypothetical protein